jgi:hypothetical protein
MEESYFEELDDGDDSKSLTASDFEILNSDEFFNRFSTGEDRNSTREALASMMEADLVKH